MARDSIPVVPGGHREWEVGEGNRDLQMQVIGANAQTGDMVPWELAACRRYFEIGKTATVAREFRVSIVELKRLMAQPWWQDETARMRRDGAAQLDAGFSQVLEVGVAALLDRINLGEIVGKDKRTGKDVRRPMNSAALARVVNMAFVNRQLIRGEATSIPGDTDAMNRLAQKLRAIGAKDPSLIDMDTGRPVDES